MQLQSKLGSDGKTLEIKLSVDKGIFLRTEKNVSINKKYQIFTEYIGLEGKKFSAYFGVATPYKTGLKDIKIKWLNDFSGIKKQISIIVKPSTDKITIFYRINAKTPVKSDCKFKILHVKNVVINEVEEVKEVEDTFESTDSFIVQKPEQLTKAQELKLEKNLVWIFASPRSGTTWLGIKLLSDKLMTIDEPKIGTHLGFPRIREDYTLDDIDYLKDQNNYFFAESYKPVWKHFLRKLILNRIYAQIRTENKKIVIKEPSGSIAADVLAECFPNSKFIILLRDPRDIIDSFIDAFSEGGWLSKKYDNSLLPKNRISFIEQQSNRWVTLVKTLVYVNQLNPKEKKIMIKYEDLLHNTFKTLNEIYRFLNVEISDEEIEKLIQKHSFSNVPSELKGKGKAIRTAESGKWRENFNMEEKKLMEKIMGNTLQEFGYDV